MPCARQDVESWNASRSTSSAVWSSARHQRPRAQCLWPSECARSLRSLPMFTILRRTPGRSQTTSCTARYRPRTRTTVLRTRKRRVRDAVATRPHWAVCHYHRRAGGVDPSSGKRRRSLAQGSRGAAAVASPARRAVDGERSVRCCGAETRS